MRNDVLTLAHGSNSDGCMEMFWCNDKHTVNIFFIGE